MDFLFDLLGEGLLSLLGKLTRRCKGKTQIVLDIVVIVVASLVVDGYAVWRAIHHYRQGELLIAGIFALAVVLSVLLAGFVLCRILWDRKK